MKFLIVFGMGLVVCTVIISITILADLIGDYTESRFGIDVVQLIIYLFIVFVVIMFCGAVASALLGLI